ncbi:hypothetical protein CPB84DRAFT_1656978, partial [Gymnopilus junonius]
HLLKFGNSLWCIERRSGSNKYRPCSSFLPPRIISLILDVLLIIHFPADLEQVLNDSWVHYSSHSHALFDSIIGIQTSIDSQHMTSKE